jgi:signal transduction histidine kinase
MLAWLDTATGAWLVMVAALSWRTGRRPAVLALLAGVAWFAGDLDDRLLLVHRPLLLWAALVLPSGRVTGRYPKLLLALWWAGALVQTVGAQPAAAIALAGCATVEAWRLRVRPAWGRRRAARTASRAVLALALASATPAVVRLAWPDAVPGDTLVVIYDILVATCAAMIFVGTALRSPADETDAVIELTDRTPEETLTALRRESSERTDPAVRAVLDRAVALLEANAASQAELAAQVDEVLVSRSRLVETAVVERRRLERLLADGARRYLDELAAVLRELGAGQRSADQLVAACLDEVGHVREDLDQLARGLHPRTLVEHGLATALTALAARNPVPTAVTAPAGRFPLGAETTVWYACAEALTNLTKHAHATKALVDVRLEGSALLAVVRDDGVGGAHLSPGGGLSGLVDRLAAVGGAMSLRPAPGGGTDVRITVPLS